jgi:class II lanthipeptide synthase
MRRARVELVDAATSIGRMLCTTAYWHERRCNWIGRSPREATEPGMPITPTVTALGPQLYNGTAGIALFLAQLHAQTHLEEVYATARGAIEHALWRSDDLPAGVRRSFYSGLVGVAYAAAQVGALLDDSCLVDEGLQLAHRAIVSRCENNFLDLMSGNAGAIAPLLWLARLQGGEPLLASTIELAEELATTATKREGTWCWDNDHACGKGIGPTPLCGLAHGASGMGLALIEMGVHCQREDWIEGGLAAFRYEDQLYDIDRGNWPDLREIGSGQDETRVSKRASFMVAWCHGAAGIGLARLRAVKLLPDRRSELMMGVERAIHATATQLRALPAYVDASPCHGRAGLAETFLYATDVLEDVQYRAQVVQMWRRLVRTRAGDPQWPCGVASGRNNPSLMLGHAGVGYALLRAADRFLVPSILVIDCTEHSPHLSAMPRCARRSSRRSLA